VANCHSQIRVVASVSRFCLKEGIGTKPENARHVRFERAHSESGIERTVSPKSEPVLERVEKAIQASLRSMMAIMATWIMASAVEGWNS
jgi:hypothetical protein